jgi:adenine phosphoribosyltransferase
MPLLADADALREAVERMAEWAEPRRPELVVGGEARGFFLGAALAYRLGCGFVPARRPGKLPLETVKREYELEYGSNVLEVQADALAGCTRVLIHDDVLATGGTARAMAELVEHLGGEVVGFTFLIELTFLPGRERIADYEIFSVIEY